MKKIHEQAISIFLTGMIALSALGSSHLLCIDTDEHKNLSIENLSGNCSPTDTAKNSITEKECCHHCVNTPIQANHHEDYTSVKRLTSSRNHILILSFKSDSFLSSKATPSTRQSTSYQAGLALHLNAPLTLRI